MKKLIFLMGSAVMLATAGCGDDPAPVAAVTPVSTKPRAAVVEEAKPAEATLVYNYTGVGKRDPFRSPNGLPTGPAGPGPQEEATNPCKDPVCKLEIDDLSVVAIVSGDANPIAMLEDRTGVGHIVRRNGYIGKGGAKVTAIRQDCIQVTTFPKGADGVVHPEKQDMCVKKEFTEAQTQDLLQGK